MVISVIGIGYVGLVTVCAFAHAGYKVIGIEKDIKKLEILKQGICPVYEDGLNELLKSCISKNQVTFTPDYKKINNSDVIFITVGTPSLPNGQVDLSQIHNVMNDIVSVLNKPAIIVMKSTVPPGTGENFKKKYLNKIRVPVSYVSNPEFLREGNALRDWYYPDRIVIGGDDKTAIRHVEELYQDIDAPKIIMDITSAEMVKYASNAFLATKISFINEIANLCELVGADIKHVSAAVGLDNRIGQDYLNAGLGYGGSCFPKDTKCLNHVSTFKGYSFNLLKAVIEVNFFQRVAAVRKLSEGFESLDGKKIAILGLAFKPHTDDLREAPVLDIIPQLLSEGASVVAYDPLAMEKARKLLPPAVQLAPTLYECTENANAVLLSTEWPEFLSIDWNEIKNIMKPPYVVVDGRNALNKVEMQALGFSYRGFGC
jgi:UDPglucose 6-dehydrogenase